MRKSTFNYKIVWWNVVSDLVISYICIYFDESRALDPLSLLFVLPDHIALWDTIAKTWEEYFSFLHSFSMKKIPELHEKSAGGIVYRRRMDELEILMLAWKNAREEIEYVLPKWKIENSEKAMETALREISEESWLFPHDLEVIKFMNKVHYDFIANHLPGSPLVHKEVHLFLVRYTGKKEPRPRSLERFVWYKWFSLSGLKSMHIKPDVVGFIEKNIQFMV